MLGAAEGAGAGAGAGEELVLLAAPNRLGVGTEEDEVVELVVGLLAMKENDGFGAAGESVQWENMLLLVTNTFAKQQHFYL